MSNFVKKELIEKVVKFRYSKKHGHDITSIHIRITEKLLTFLQPKTTNQPDAQDMPSTDDDKKYPQGEVNQTADEHNFAQNEESGLSKSSIPSINKDNGINIVNNIVNQDVVNFVNKNHPSFTKTTFAIEKEIGERVTSEKSALGK